jgi:hypothetical protein
MKIRFITLFTQSAGLILLLTALAKLVSSAGHQAVLLTSDPVFGIPFRCFFLATGVVELIIALFCLTSGRVRASTVLIMWLTINCLVYRAGMYWVGYNSPCKCLGTLTDSLHISPGTADAVLKIILAYFGIGSCAALWILHRRSEVLQAQAA